MDDLVCPACGHGQFTQTRTTRTEYRLEYSPEGGWFEVAEEQADSGDMGDHEIVCADCGLDVEEHELVTHESYSDGEYV